MEAPLMGTVLGISSGSVTWPRSCRTPAPHAALCPRCAAERSAPAAGASTQRPLRAVSVVVPRPAGSGAGQVDEAPGL